MNLKKSESWVHGKVWREVKKRKEIMQLYSQIIKNILKEGKEIYEEFLYLIVTYIFVWFICNKIMNTLFLQIQNLLQNKQFLFKKS